MAVSKQGLVTQVLQISGLMGGKLLADLTVPDQRTRAWLFGLYNPAGGRRGRSGTSSRGSWRKR
nr:hypothetical protein GCM10020093_008030 [Planobispora longispora]